MVSRLRSASLGTLFKGEDVIKTLTTSEKINELLISNRPDLIDAIARGNLSLDEAWGLLNPTGWTDRAWDRVSVHDQITFMREILPWCSASLMRGGGR